MIRSRTMTRLLPTVATAAFIFACRPAKQALEETNTTASRAAQADAEKKRLERQVAALERAIVDSKKGALFSPDYLAVGASEDVAKQLIARALPIEKDVTKDFHAKIDQAQVSFRSFEASVVLQGRISRKGDPSTFADLKLIGGIPTIEIEENGKTLRADIVLDSFDVTRAAAMGAEHDLVTLAARELGARGLDALRELVPPLRFPITLEQAIDVPGVSEGPATIRGGRLPLSAKVARVLPVSGRLWAMVAVDTAGWTEIGGGK